MRKTRRRFLWGVLAALAIFASSTAAVSASARTAMAVTKLPETLIPIGHTVGIKLFSEGILVVGLSEVETSQGAQTPAKDSGLIVGDIILSADGKAIESTEHFQQLVADSKGSAMELTTRRSGKTMEVTACAAACTDGVYRMGAWVRDSLAGIGTMTFYDPVNDVFGALGHGINDTDTGLLMPLQAGSIMPSKVKAVNKGKSGAPGELRGDFDLSTDAGTLYANSAAGIFGVMGECAYAVGDPLPVASPEEIHTGNAEILSNIEGDTVERYAIEIESICDRDGPTKNFILHITDEKLLSKTGGVVQGMSGSPVLQDGKLIGAVTHVMVDDAERGYGIFISNMMDTAYTVPS